MVDHKSQHYVPRVYLKNFANWPHKKTISLFNISQRKRIDGAPIKSQCASDYFYGCDELEGHLGDVEGQYAEWVTRGVLMESPFLVEDVDVFLRFFISIQYMRTAAQVARMQAAMALVGELAGMPSGDSFMAALDLSDTTVARENVFRALEIRRAISDLKFSFIRNESSIPFITCDDPVILTNRLYIQRLNQTNFGLANAGAIIYIPLSPRVAVILYDSNVYSLDKNVRWWSVVKKSQDAVALNGMMYLKAVANIYFAEDCEFNIDHYRDVDSDRISDWRSGRVLRQIGEDESGRFFAEVDERPENESYIIGISQQNPKISNWPTVLRFRQGAYAFSNNSGAGLLRSAMLPPGSHGFVKIRV